MPVAIHFRKTEVSQSCKSLLLTSSNLISPKPQSQTQPPFVDAEAGSRQGCFAQGH